MFRLFVVPISIGILASLGIYFVAPVFVPAPGVTVYVGEFILDLSNSYFETMPPIVASYITSLNLAVVALTAGLLVVLVIQLVVTIVGAFVCAVRWIVSCLQKEEAEEVDKDLPPIEMDPKYMHAGPGEDIFGRGLDSLERK